MTIKVILFQLLLELNTPEIQGIIYQDLEKPNRCGEMLLPFIFWVVFKVWLFLFLAKWASHHVPRHPVTSAAWQGGHSCLGCTSSEEFKPWERRGK